ncbi:MAG: FtsW/RodA/SpoVE family cell cycle protein [bacterium]|nr:FtsW/RodA/SpoVE family cell cycle protein [bacterium]
MAWRLPLRHLRYYDWLLLSAVVVLCAFSLAALYGIATGFEIPDFGNLRKQVLFIALGMLALVSVSTVNTRWLKQYAIAGYVLGALLLSAVLLFGQTRSGTTGWFTLGPVGFQPVEVAKFALIILLAHLLAARPSGGGLPWRLLAESGGITALYCGLTLLQPDFGSAMLLLVIWLGMVFFAGVTARQVLAMAAVVGVLGAGWWTFFSQDFQHARIVTFLNPAADPYGRGYQVRQSIIAVGAGQLLGRGLGSGSQSQLKFIPASQTDFIFAVIAEELGLLGAGVVLAAYLVLLLRLAALVRRAADDFAAALVHGIAVLLFVHIVINIGMNLGLLPVTGIPLPLLSYGGSYLVITLTLLGVAQSVAISSVKYRA